MFLYISPLMMVMVVSFHSMCYFLGKHFSMIYLGELGFIDGRWVLVCY